MSNPDVALEAAARALGFRTPESFARLRAAIAAYEKAMWRPIEEAPKDGNPIDLWCNFCGIGERAANARWSAQKNGWVQWGPNDYGDIGYVRVDGSPTHFRLLPLPPEVE